jgi:CBS domain-containing protein
MAELKSYVTRPVKVIKSNDSLILAAREMRNHNIGSLLVLDENEKIVGIITERDIVKAFADGNFDAKVSDYMTRDVKGLRLDSDINTALKVMIDNGFRHLPIVSADNKEVYGIVSIRDLVRAIVNLDPIEPPKVMENVCPVCGLEIDEYGYCGCGAGSD